MARRKKSRNRRVSLPEVDVNITSLLDVLTVLLFFLIKSFSVSSASVKVPENLRLPTSVSDDQFEESVTVVLSRETLMLKDEVIAKLRNGKFKKSDIDAENRVIGDLYKKLSNEFNKKKEIFAKIGGDASIMPPGKILIQSDKRLKFGSIKYLLRTISLAGYTDYQFVVAGESD